MKDDFETHFGFKKVGNKEKTSLVRDVFRRVASKYDLMNDAMSLGVHRLWKDEFINMLRLRSNMHILDVAGGTGDIAFRILKQAEKFNNSIEVTVCDINEHMIQNGRDKAIDQGFVRNLNWRVGNGEQLPFPDDTFDAYTISFGLRNISDIPLALKEAHRVLKTGGQFFCLEFSKVESDLLKKLYHTYSFGVIPKLGKLIANDQESYQYLVESIEQFPDQKTLANLMHESGFQQTTFRNLTNGIVAIHSGMKL